MITATDVDEIPSVAGRDDATGPDTAHMVEENANLLDEADLTNSIYDPFMYLAVATDDDDTVSLLLNGDDAAAFKLVDRDGAVGTGTVHGLTFKEAPNYEKPTDARPCACLCPAPRHAPRLPSTALPERRWAPAARLRGGGPPLSWSPRSSASLIRHDIPLPSMHAATVRRSIPNTLAAPLRPPCFFTRSCRSAMSRSGCSSSSSPSPATVCSSGFIVSASPATCTTYVHASRFSLCTTCTSQLGRMYQPAATGP